MNEYPIENLSIPIINPVPAPTPEIERPPLGHLPQ